jgi:hypothetical protein
MKGLNSIHQSYVFEVQSGNEVRFIRIRHIETNWARYHYLMLTTFESFDGLQISISTKLHCSSMRIQDDKQKFNQNQHPIHAVLNIEFYRLNSDMQFS